jgi:apolipoprotein N-acyltransferase
MKFNPYGYDHSLDAGTEYTVFEMTTPVRNPAGDELTAKETISSNPYKFSVIICYEATLPAIVRRFVLNDKGKKQIDWLINISNDGWFVRFKGDKVYPSTELPQHMAICAFRAVEHRLSVLRSVNTGISCIIDTLGRVKNGYLAGTLPNNALERKGISGWFVDNLPIDGRTTFFSKYGQWLDFCCALAFILFIIVPPVTKVIGSKRYVIFSRQQQNGK